MSEYLKTSEDDVFAQIYEQVKEKWKLNDPYLLDTEGLRKEFRKIFNEYMDNEEQNCKKRAEEFKKILDVPWLKQLEELAPRHKGLRLEDRIYKELIVEAMDFKQGMEKEYESNLDLLIQLKIAHGKFTKERGEFMDMFGEYLMETNQLNYKPLGQCLTPEPICDFIVRSVASEKDLNTLMSWYDPACGTGRFMLRTAKYFAQELGRFNFVFFNQDIDKKMYVYTSMNAILNDIPSLNILGNTLIGETREAVVTVPIMPGFTPWYLIEGERVPYAMNSLLYHIEKSNPPQETVKTEATQG